MVSIVRAPPNHSPCPGCYYLFHIGAGRSGHQPNRNNATCKSTAKRPEVVARKLKTVFGLGQSLIGHRSLSPYGPWVPIAGPSCNNPAPAFDADGVLFIVCNTEAIFRAEGNATDPRQLVWTRIGEVPLSKWILPRDVSYVYYEDGYLYLDHRGNWHFLTHTYDYRDSMSNKTKGKDLPTVSSHAFSRDLNKWFLSPVQPFLSKVEYEDGTSKSFGEWSIFKDDVMGRILCLTKRC